MTNSWKWTVKNNGWPWRKSMIYKLNEWIKWRNSMHLLFNRYKRAFNKVKRLIPAIRLMMKPEEYGNIGIMNYWNNMNHFLIIMLSFKAIKWLTVHLRKIKDWPWWIKNMHCCRMNTIKLSSSFKIHQIACNPDNNIRICWSILNNFKAISSSLRRKIII
jgi:hypothetical protein